MSLLFSTAYLPPVKYILLAIQNGSIILDAHEHFVKQSYRSRSTIYGPNGKQDLIIPVVHTDLFTIPIKEVKIHNESRWQKIHWRSLEAAYKNSPFFEFYEDDLRPFYEKKYEYLFDFNLDLLQTIFRIKKAKVEITLTEKYDASYPELKDLRNYFHPKNNFESVGIYHQVFADKHGFIDRLSYLDYLFNGGEPKGTLSR